MHLKGCGVGYDPLEVLGVYQQPEVNWVEPTTSETVSKVKCWGTRQ